MRHRRLALAIPAALATLVALAPAPAAAQVPWDAPFLVSPNAPPGWGLLLVDLDEHSGMGVMTTVRSGGPRGYRAGVAEGDDDEVVFFGGIDYSGTVHAATDALPLDVRWVLGAGVGVSDGALLSFPVALGFGRELVGESVTLSPYVVPRVAADLLFGSDDADDRIDLGFAVDLGLDLSFDPGWDLRFAGSLGDREALAIGFSFRVL